jgi:hypothetical protein
MKLSPCLIDIFWLCSWVSVLVYLCWFLNLSPFSFVWLMEHGAKYNVEEDDSSYDSEVIMNNNPCMIFAGEGTRLHMYIRSDKSRLQSSELTCIRILASLIVWLCFCHWFRDTPSCTQRSPWCSDLRPNLSQSLRLYSSTSYQTSLLLLNLSSEIPVTLKARPECSPVVCYSPEIDPSKITLHILSDTPGDIQRLKYILLTDW